MSQLFSVIMPVYNRGDLILESLSSLFMQTYRPIQLIIVDDGSTDHTSKVIEAWRKSVISKDQITVNYIYQNNAGASAGRNRGIKEVKGKYVQFFDSDDLMHSERLEKLVKVFNATGADFVQTGFDSFDPETKKLLV